MANIHKVKSGDIIRVNDKEFMVTEVTQSKVPTVRLKEKLKKGGR